MNLDNISNLNDEELLEKILGPENPIALLLSPEAIQEAKNSTTPKILQSLRDLLKIIPVVQQMDDNSHKQFSQMFQTSLVQMPRFEELMNAFSQMNNNITPGIEAKHPEAMNNFRELLNEINTTSTEVETRNIQVNEEANEAENEEVYRRPRYEGFCGIKLHKTDDPEAQQILDKYLPREGLNQHSYDLIRMFNEMGFKELQESNDKYPINVLFNDFLTLIFMSHDKDFQIFLRQKSLEELLEMAKEKSPDEEFNRELFTYLFSVQVN